MTEQDRTRETLSQFLRDLEALSRATAELLEHDRKPITPPTVAKPSPQLPFDASKIKWEYNEAKDNPKGPFELSHDYDNEHHKALVKFIADSGVETLFSEGFVYWVFQDGKTIGRRKKGVKHE